MTFMESFTPTAISIITSALVNMQCSKQMKNSKNYDHDYIIFSRQNKIIPRLKLEYAKYQAVSYESKAVFRRLPANDTRGNKFWRIHFLISICR